MFKKGDIVGYHCRNEEIESLQKNRRVAFARLILMLPMAHWREDFASAVAALRFATATPRFATATPVAYYKNASLVQELERFGTAILIARHRCYIDPDTFSPDSVSLEHVKKAIVGS